MTMQACNQDQNGVRPVVFAAKCRLIVLKNIYARHKIRVNMAQGLYPPIPTSSKQYASRTPHPWRAGATGDRSVMRNDSTQQRPVVALIGTGGTIAAVAGVETQLSDYTVSNDVGLLVGAVPALQSLATFESEQVCNIESHSIDDALLLRIAHRVNAWLAMDHVTAAVITHGTDTLEETAYFLNLVIKSEKPVVLVGAMRPASALSADGPLNLFHAVSVAVCPESAGKGVLVVMNDRVIAARYATKGHTTNVDAFVIPEQGCLGVVSGRDVHYFNSPMGRHTVRSEFHLDPAQAALPPVDILYDYQGAGTHLFESALQAGVHGIVLAATGNGSLSPAALAGAKLAVGQGVAFVRASRVGQGSVRHSQRDASLGLVAAQSLNPQKARVLLRLALLAPRDRDALQRLFDEY